MLQQVVTLAKKKSLIVKGPKVGPKWSKIHQKYNQFQTNMGANPPQMGSCGPVVDLGAPLWPPGTSKSQLFGPFRVPLGPLWAPRGAIWTPIGGHFGDLCVSKIDFFYHVMSRPTFCIILGCFLEHFGSIWGVFWVELGCQIAFDLEKSSYTQTYVFRR